MNQNLHGVIRMQTERLIEVASIADEEESRHVEAAKRIAKLTADNDALAKQLDIAMIELNRADARIAELEGATVKAKRRK